MLRPLPQAGLLHNRTRSLDRVQVGAIVTVHLHDHPRATRRPRRFRVVAFPAERAMRHCAILAPLDSPKLRATLACHWLEVVG